MFELNDQNEITITRGDSGESILVLNQGTALEPIQYVLKSGDELYLGVCDANQPFENALIKKTFSNVNLNSDGNTIIRFEPNDTVNLIPGTYFYQIKAKFIITAQVINLDVSIVSNTVLKAGSELTAGSKINGNEVVIESGYKYYTLQNDTTLSAGDIIKANSVISLPSTINNIVINTTYDINTVVQKTRFIIMD